MTQLTPILAAHCARACGWPRRGGDKPGRRIYWIDKNGHEVFNLSRDPDFWFPRLWTETLRAYRERDEFIALVEGGVEFGRGDGMDFAPAKNDNYCEALCAAIEAVKGEKDA